MKEIFARANKNGYKWVLENSGDCAESWEDVVLECALYDKSPPPSLNDLLADEGFVKALFGEEPVCCLRPEISECTTSCRPFNPDCIYTKKAYIALNRELSTIFNYEEKIKYIKERMI